MTITRRIAAGYAAGFALAVAPAVIFLGAVTAHAEAPASAPAAAVSVSHPAFPHQDNFPQPGTSVHHHHQNHR